MKKCNISKRLLCLCLTTLMVLSLAACGGKADEQDSAPSTNSTSSVSSLQTTNNIQPAEEVPPTPTPAIPFTDVAEDSSYYDAVKWAYENGIASDGSVFNPDSACTRAQVVTFIWRAKGSPEPQITESPFSDVSSTNWFYKPALWAYENGVASSTTFSPGNPCTNAEALTFLWRAEGKPAAAIDNSTVALAASGAYYARPAAWADNNGMFAEMNFDPTAPCSRADFTSYLYWAIEGWTFTEEDKTVQTEYEQIISGAQLYEVHGSGLLYADYVDVDNDGKVELLTVDSGENLSDFPGWPAYNAVATVYTNIDGHAGKLCEQIFDCTSSEGFLSLCAYDGQVCFHYETLIHGVGPEDVFYTVENGVFVVSDQISMEREDYLLNNQKVSEAEYNATIEKYANQKELFWYNSDGISVRNRGILPSAAEYWVANRDQIYAAVLNGDFSYFAGSYKGMTWDWENIWMTLDENGIVTDSTGYYTAQKPVSIAVTETGLIYCVVQPETIDVIHEGKVYYKEEYFYICPAYVDSDPDVFIFYEDEYGYGNEYGIDAVRILYANLGGSVRGDFDVYHKVH